MAEHTREIQHCAGFKAAGIAAGIKKKNGMDLGMMVSDAPCAAAAVFTRNRVQAAPVILSRERIKSGTAQAVVVNSGNANCCTGAQGAADADAMAAAVARVLGIEADHVLVASTGVIGEPLPLNTIETAIPELAARLREDGFGDLAAAIMTTDTVPKLIGRRASIGGQPVTVLATAKGAGMIRPDMATMLCFVCTDADIAADALHACLRHAVDRTLNTISIDGDTSTNDMVLLMASGKSGVQVDTGDQLAQFEQLLIDLLADVARALVRDGEGVSKVVEVVVAGASSDADARRVADTVAHSPLVKTAFFGEDANWGRIFAAAGRAGVKLDPDRIDLYFDDVQMAADGRGCGPEAEARATRVLQGSELTVTLQLNQGRGRASVLTCDFSVDYVKINADYRT